MQINTDLDKIIAGKPDVLTDIYSHGLNFKDIPGTVLSAFGIEKGQDKLKFSDELRSDYQNVILILADNFGWNLFERYHQGISLFQKYSDSTKVDKIFSQFPSTTTAHVTTMFSGLPVYEHGLYEWRMYSERLDRSITPLMYTQLINKEKASIEQGPDTLFDSGSFYQTLAGNDINITIPLQAEFAKSRYNEFYSKNTNLLPFKNSAEGFVATRKLIKDSSEKQFVYLYHSWIDTNSHGYGPYSLETAAAVDLFFYKVEKFLLDQIQDTNTLVLICADHGQVRVDDTTYLDHYPELMDMLEVDASGDVFILGSSRDVFLKVKEGRVGEAQRFLARRLSEVADTITFDELAATGMLSDKYENLRHMGDLVVLPKQGHAVWWDFDGKFVKNYIGMHGGNSVEEMTTPFIRIET